MILKVSNKFQVCKVILSLLLTLELLSKLNICPEGVRAKEWLDDLCYKNTTAVTERNEECGKTESTDPFLILPKQSVRNNHC